jgi:hypothetical protein
MSKRNPKKEKALSMDLITLMEFEREALQERSLYINLLAEKLDTEGLDYRLLEMLCDGLSISNKLLREIDLIVSRNPIMIPEERKVEQVVLFPEDRTILEAIILTRSHLRQDMRRIKNISSYYH